MHEANDTAWARLRVDKATTPHEREAVYRLRYRIVVDEMGKRPPGADHAKKTLSDELDAIANTFYLADGGEAVAALRSVPAAKAPDSRQVQFYELDKMPEVPREAITFTSRLILAPEWRGTRALGMLLGAVYEDSRRTGTWLDLVNVTPSLVALYEVMGYRRFLPSVMDPEAGLCFPMAMVADDIEYLTRVRSPFAPLADRFANDPKHGRWFAARFAEYAQPSCARVMGSDEFWRYLTERIHVEDYPLLRGLTPEQVKHVLGAGSVVRVAKGGAVVRAGEPGNDMYMVLSGALEVRAGAGDSSRVLETLGSGQIFGEMSFLSNKPRTADVIAVSDAEVLLLTRDYFERLTQAAPAIASRLLMNLSIYLVERLQHTTQGLIGRGA